jgi:uncharacterized protein YjbJ (UPF0337 family)
MPADPAETFIERAKPPRAGRHDPCVFPGRQSIHRSHKGAAMNKDILAGKWKEMKGRVKEQWGKITDDELDRAEGKAEQMIGLLQQRYGYSKERAEEEYDRFMKDQEMETRR